MARLLQFYCKLSTGTTDSFTALATVQQSQLTHLVLHIPCPAVVYSCDNGFFNVRLRFLAYTVLYGSHRRKLDRFVHVQPLYLCRPLHRLTRGMTHAYGGLVTRDRATLLDLDINTCLLTG